MIDKSVLFARFLAASLPFTIATAGCSPAQTPGATETQNASEQAQPAAAPVHAAPAASQPAEDAHIKPAPGMQKTFGDWTVGCDNALRCTLGSLLPEGGFPSTGDESTITLNLTREPGPAGAVSVRIETRNDETAQARPPASFAVDDTPFALRDTTHLAEAMANGTALTIRDKGGKMLATLSLKGAAAALRYMDAQQGRVGSTDAIVAKGLGASTAPHPPLPVIAAIAPSGAAATLTRSQIARMRTQAKCDLASFPAGAGPDIVAPDVHALGGGKTLVILPCSTGAYNLTGALFVIDGAKIIAPSTDAPSGFEETGADSRTPVHSVVNGTFENGVLTSYAKGRGLGDCGVHQAFVWDGTRFRLSEQSEMGECRGNIDYINTWRAKVVR